MISLLPEMSIEPAPVRAPAAALGAAGEPSGAGDPFAAVLAAALPATSPPTGAGAGSGATHPNPDEAVLVSPPTFVAVPSSSSPRISRPGALAEQLDGLRVDPTDAPKADQGAAAFMPTETGPVPLRPGPSGSIPLPNPAGMRQSVAALPPADSLALATVASGAASIPATSLPVTSQASAGSDTLPEPAVAPHPVLAGVGGASALNSAPAISMPPAQDEPSEAPDMNDDPAADGLAVSLTPIPIMAAPIPNAPMPSPVPAPSLSGIGGRGGALAEAQVNAGLAQAARIVRPAEVATLPAITSDEIGQAAFPALSGEVQPGADPMPASAPVAESGASAAPAAPASSIVQASPGNAVVPAESRGEARVQPQQDAAIDQIADLRDAARASRPDVLLRHAEFGMVSTKVEGSSPQDWRAVLASRDPGFVPAVQAALADRIVTGAATDLTGNLAGQNPSQDQRYGSSPGSGQGSSQPYMQHQQGRDEGAFGHQRGQGERSTRLTAASGDEAAPDSAATHARGLFA